MKKGVDFKSITVISVKNVGIKALKLKLKQCMNEHEDNEDEMKSIAKILWAAGLFTLLFLGGIIYLLYRIIYG